MFGAQKIFNSCYIIAHIWARILVHTHSDIPNWREKASLIFMIMGSHFSGLKGYHAEFNLSGCITNSTFALVCFLRANAYCTPMHS